MLHSVCLLKTAVCALAWCSASWLPAALPAGGKLISDKLGGVDARLAKIEKAIIASKLYPPRTILPTGKANSVDRTLMRIHARLARMELAVSGRSLLAPRTVLPTGTTDRGRAERTLAGVDARLAGIERAIVGSALPSQYAVSYTGTVERDGVARILANMNARLARMESVIHRQAKAWRRARFPSTLRGPETKEQPVEPK